MAQDSKIDMAELGRKFGAKLATFADQAEEKLRAAGVEPETRCASCAFRAGTFPNTKAPATGLDALKCLIEKHPFGCHHDKGPDGLPTKLCGGFVNILAAETGPRLTEAPWPFSDEVEPEARSLTQGERP